GYNLVMDGPSDAMRFGFGIDAQYISLDSPAMPASYSPFVPTNFDLQLSIPNLDFAISSPLCSGGLALKSIAMSA
ncbi:hypothetical protein ACC746_36965, partial [Rhizobium ruizarguesonis]